MRRIERDALDAREEARLRFFAVEAVSRVPCVFVYIYRYISTAVVRSKA